MYIFLCGVCVLESVHSCRTSRELQETVVVLMKQSLQLTILLEQPEVVLPIQLIVLFNFQ